MENNKNSLLPYVFGIVTQKPQRSCDFEQICREMEMVLRTANVAEPEDIQGAVDEAIEEGIGLGVLSINGEKIRVPFPFATATVSQMQDGNTQTGDKADDREPLEKKTDAKVKKAKKVNNKRPLQKNLRQKTATKAAKGVKVKPNRRKAPARKAQKKNAMAKTPIPMQNETTQAPHEVAGSTSPVISKPNKVIARKRRLNTTNRSKRVGQTAKRFKVQQPPLKAKNKKVMRNARRPRVEDGGVAKPMPKHRKQPYRKAAQDKSAR